MERKRRLPKYFRPSLEYPDIPFHGMLEESLRRVPDHVALIFEDEEITFRELEALSNSFAHALRELGVRKGDRVSLFMFNRTEFVIAVYAVSKLGAIFTPLNPTFKEEETLHQHRDSGARVAIVHEDNYPILRAVRGELPELETVVLVGDSSADGLPLFHELLRDYPPSRPPAPPIAPSEDLIALPYSSGTTGLPKGVMLTHRNLVSNYIQFVANHRVTERDRVIVFLPLYHIFGTMIMGGCIYEGAAQVLMERFNAEECLRLIEKHRVTLFYGVPPALLSLCEYPSLKKFDLSSLRFIASGAASLPPEVRRRLEELTGVPTFMVYGLTEASPVTHMNHFEPDLIEPSSIGPPVSDQPQKVVDPESGEEVAPGEVGELVVRGPHVMKGYWRDEEETERVLREGWLYTGDLVAMDEDGYVYIKDRKKEMIKYKGFAVAPGEVEALLHRHPAVADCAVTSKPDSEAGEIPKAFVVLKDGARASADEIMAFVAEHVAGYKRVREVEFLDSIPKSASGKILRRVLRDREREKTEKKRDRR